MKTLCIEALFEYHETGGHRGDGSDACLVAARSELAAANRKLEVARKVLEQADSYLHALDPDCELADMVSAALKQMEE